MTSRIASGLVWPSWPSLYYLLADVFRLFDDSGESSIFLILVYIHWISIVILSSLIKSNFHYLPARCDLYSFLLRCDLYSNIFNLFECHLHSPIYLLCSPMTSDFKCFPNLSLPYFRMPYFRMPLLSLYFHIPLETYSLWRVIYRIHSCGICTHALFHLNCF